MKLENRETIINLPNQPALIDPNNGRGRPVPQISAENALKIYDKLIEKYPNATYEYFQGYSGEVSVNLYIGGNMYDFDVDWNGLVTLIWEFEHENLEWKDEQYPNYWCKNIWLEDISVELALAILEDFC